MERLDFDLPFRWFVGLGIDDPVWDRWPLFDALAQGLIPHCSRAGGASWR